MEERVVELDLDKIVDKLMEQIPVPKPKPPDRIRRPKKPQPKEDADGKPVR